MLHAESVKLIKFTTKSDIQEYIDKDQLWAHMGGTVSNIDDYDCVKIFPITCFNDP